MATMETVSGSDLQVGDAIDTWMGRKRIVALRPYTGPLAELWSGRAQVADFDIGLGMTIEPDARFSRVAVAA